VRTNRLEAFSDGVLAVAITVLVLNIVVPDPLSLGQDHHPATLGGALSANWPAYVAYATSFMTIGIIWINHHAALGRLREADHSILMINLVLLMTVAVIPFGTSLMATYLKQGNGDTLAATVYAGIFLAMALAFSWFNYHLLIRRKHLLSGNLSDARRRKLLIRGVAGVPPYILATAVAPFSAYATLAMTTALAVFYALPVTAGTD
jgi:uncharacterized membrane protein